MYQDVKIEMVTKKRFDRERKLKKEAEMLLEKKTRQLYEAKSLLKKKIDAFTDSVQYALRIQQAILPSTHILRGLFQDHFILYKPKAIVSGDFYWCTKIENKVIIAVLDCTGHGVPGAFMSMIGNTLLNEIVIQSKTLNPSEILRLLHLGIQGCLQQNENDINDGMDLGLCCLDFENEDQIKLDYAGAKHKLFIIKNRNLFELKSDRHSIGGLPKEKPLDFKSQSMCLSKGDQLYLTTDGYIDQANPLRKRLGIIKFKSLLLSMFQLNMDSQKEALYQELYDHQQEADQRDDITILGIKL